MMTSRLIRKYLENQTRYRQTEKDFLIAKGPLHLPKFGKLWPTYG